MKQLPAAKVIGVYAPGDSVPEWLMEISNTEVPRDRMKQIFRCAAVVIEIPEICDEYFLIFDPARHAADHAIEVEGDNKGVYVIKATSKTVHCLICEMSFHGPQSGGYNN
jgi:hypothetical protein